MSAFEEKLRWPGAPQICLATNLPAFFDEKALKKFNEEKTPGCKILKIWLCKKCKHYHQWGILSARDIKREIPARILKLIADTKSV